MNCPLPTLDPLTVPPCQNGSIDLSEVPTRDLIAMLHLQLARCQARQRVDARLAGKSRDPIGKKP